MPSRRPYHPRWVNPVDDSQSRASDVDRSLGHGQASASSGSELTIETPGSVITFTSPDYSQTIDASSRVFSIDTPITFQWTRANSSVQVMTPVWRARTVSEFAGDFNDFDHLPVENAVADPNNANAYSVQLNTTGLQSELGSEMVLDIPWTVADTNVQGYTRSGIFSVTTDDQLDNVAQALQKDIDSPQGLGQPVQVDSPLPSSGSIVSTTRALPTAMHHTMPTAAPESSSTSESSGPSSSSHSSSKLSKGAIIGIAAGGGAALFIITSIFFWWLCCFRSRRARQKKRETRPYRKDLDFRDSLTDSNGCSPTASHDQDQKRDLHKENQQHKMHLTPQQSREPRSSQEHRKSRSSQEQRKSRSHSRQHQKQQNSLHTSKPSRTSNVMVVPLEDLPPSQSPPPAPLPVAVVHDANKARQEARKQTRPKSRSPPPVTTINTNVSNSSSSRSKPAAAMTTHEKGKAQSKDRLSVPSNNVNIMHLIEDGMTEADIRRLEEEERHLDNEIQLARRQGVKSYASSLGSISLRSPKSPKSPKAALGLGRG